VRETAPRRKATRGKIFNWKDHGIVKGVNTEKNNEVPTKRVKSSWRGTNMTPIGKRE